MLAWREEGELCVSATRRDVWGGCSVFGDWWLLSSRGVGPVVFVEVDHPVGQGREVVYL